MNTELKNAILKEIESNGLKGLAQTLKAAFEENADNEAGISTTWQINVFVDQLNKA